MIKENKFKNAIAYFRYHFLQSGKFILFISIVAGIISFITAINGQPVYRYNEGGEYVLKYYNPTLEFSVFVIWFLCFLVPVLQFSFFKKRRNLDYIYSMPISRTEVGAVHYAVGLLEVFIPFTVSYLINFLVFASWGFADNKLLPFIPFYFWCLLYGWIFYSIFCFAFNEANTVADGCIFMGFWSFIFALLSESLELINSSDHLIPFVVLGNITIFYSRLARGYTVEDALVHSGSAERHINEYLTIFFIIVAATAVVYLLVTFGKRRTEKAEDISDSPFGYVSMIPLYALLILMYVFEISILIIVTIATIIGYTIFRRGFKYKVADYVVMAIPLGLCILALIQG